MAAKGGHDKIVETLVEASGLRFRDAVAQIRRDWTGDRAGADRLAAAASGISEYTPEALLADWAAIVASLALFTGDDLDGATLAEMIATHPAGRVG